MTFAEQMCAALIAAGDPYTFTDGALTITVAGCSAESDALIVASCVAFRDGVQVFSNDLLLVNAPDVGDPLTYAQLFISQTVRDNL